MRIKVDDRLFRVTVSMFAIVNLGTILFLNTPWSVDELFKARISVSPTALAVANVSSGLIQQYARLVGLDNRWNMFSWVARDNWWYFIKAEYADSTQVLLPLERQSPRSFWQNHLFDHKEVKFHLNMASQRPSRLAYADYLCRQYPVHDSYPIRSIVFELHSQRILPPDEAARSRSHLDPRVKIQILDRFACPDSKARLSSP